jgi:hypothetical protein
MLLVRVLLFSKGSGTPVPRRTRDAPYEPKVAAPPGHPFRVRLYLLRSSGRRRRCHQAQSDSGEAGGIGEVLRR